MSLDIKSLKFETKAAFLADSEESIELSTELWNLKRAKAAYVVGGVDETIYGSNLNLTQEEVAEAEEVVRASGKEPYGDVPYADHGAQKDGKKRYPIDTPEHIRSAWNYINHPKNAGKYSSSQLATIKRRIISAWKSKIDKKGPPSA